MIGTPISKSDPPDFLPFACDFDQRQCAAILKFLKFVHADWHGESEPPTREVVRGIRNWEYFTERAAQRTT